MVVGILVDTPERPQIFHIVHIDRLPSILEEGYLLSDGEVSSRQLTGTAIGMPSVKERRLNKSLLTKPELKVADCVPFYFCPRSVMLYVIHKRSPLLPYSGGQDLIIHLQAYLHEAIEWAEESSLHWAFTAINAASKIAEDWHSLNELHRINWEVVHARQWQDHRDSKQAEFLVEKRFPVSLFRGVGVRASQTATQAEEILNDSSERIPVLLKPNWYY